MSAADPSREGPAGSLARRFLVEPRRPAAIRENPNAHWYAVAAVCLGAFMGQLDASIVNLAYQPIERSFHTSLASATWVGLAYLLTLVAFVTPIGQIADVYGRKLLYIYGFGIFVVGSGLCGIAPDLAALVAFRILQAIGAAMMQANSVAIIALAMPREQLGRGIGIQGAAQALGLALGPTIGGLLVAAGGWHLIFLVNVPVGIVGIVLGRRFIARSRQLAARTPFDWAGALLLPGAAGSLLAAVSLGDQLGWESPAVIVLLTASVTLTASFVLREHTARHPMLELSLFKTGGFSSAILSGLLSYLLLFGTLFVIPLFLVSGLGLSPVRAGLELTVMPIMLGLLAPLGGRMADRIGARPLTVSGMLLAALGLGLLAFTATATAPRLIELAAIGAGLGLFTPANNAAIMGSVPRTRTGLTGGVLNMTRGIGTALGLAITTLVFESFAGTHTTVGRPGAIHTGFRGAALVLCGVAVAAAVLSSLRGGPAARLDTDTVVAAA